ncbi:MAG TPA: YbdD/YjiX family protein [Gemmatimonadales bacterium]|nr:YbdD/YjiX family protein [Gemmatimonadales bacterium]
MRARLRAVLASTAALLRRIAGMPDYAAYREHWLRHHPDRPIPSERAFYDEYLRARYGDGPTRCC